MNPTRKRRLAIVISVIAAAVVAIGLTVFALQRNMSYLFTPSQVQEGQATQYTSFRLGGMVKAGSIQRATSSLRVSFIVIDADGAMPVEYTGILPDLFRDNQSVIATGRMDSGRFIASEVLAKHDENYMPKELKDAMAKAHQNKKIDDTAMKDTPK
ncbi:cytochrome c biogenesis protein CcmE [Luteibacter rhizovicinus DSM 16549]|jgi:cytochrome c-type biogenesis protein CcmE|uniref:Cytochrome c-type biogenesis protein CcmE n=1 Tax=Luteibacter rhizovicinus DSM 16549 TaxID=1440763 RepID=A0A0G9HFP0_9GAMM|nr:cytochrome c maturation protein CcmE [Luteibacter rhizovicinus]APG05366.1 cytochrome c biogenesis protein CcmE [Luteibacter rhizovicinus DSM 16549]KLD67984.1 cytochrome C biogenesis protein CcmE [Luteibacter rhizovicinus DSM 16549]KLD73893.1 cytochrome C biogenesis protein CcmE [Xanthomonas hyacinthi DSM 19077]